MKNFAFVVVCVLFIVQQGLAQMYPSLKPKSVIYGSAIFSAPPEIVLPAFDQQWADSLDADDALQGRLPKIGRYIPVDISFNNAGKWTYLPNGGRVWRVQITSKNALGITPLFNQLYLPPGATLHAYTPDRQEILGAFTNLNTLEVHAFCPGMVHGESCIIEYYEPPAQMGKGILTMNKISHCYRGIDQPGKSIESSSGPCEVNAVCSEGDNWRDQIRSVCLINVFDLTGEGNCSGELVNNVRQDCTPYLLTAGHCTDYDSVTAQEFDQYWSFQFNYQCSTCGATTCATANPDLITGCTRVAYAYDSNGFDGSDFLLLLLNSYPPADFNVYYAGWDNTGNIPDSGVGIHHPHADCKKISTMTPGSGQSASWGGNVANTHLEMTWEATANGYGVSEPGSSGSPLFESPQKLIVGHLTGGSSCCTAGGCGDGTSPTGPDFYGKIWFDWTSNGVTPDHQLGPWLDPDYTGTTTLQGMNPPCGISAHDDVGIQTIEVPNGNICGLTFKPCFTIHNYGDDTLRSLTLTYSVDNGTTSQISWTGLLPGGAEIEVCSEASFTTTAGSHTFTVVASLPNGVADNNSSNNVLESNFNVYSVPGAVTLVFNTDNDGSQDTWQLTQQGGLVFASGGPFVDCVGGRQYIYPLCLSPDCYTFTIFDSQGDGMTDGEDGFVQVWAGGSILGQLANPSFGAQASFNFCIWPTAIQDLPAINLTILPNPSTGIFNVYFDDEQPRSVRLFDALGRQLMEKATTEQHFTLDMSAFSKGVYFAQFNTPQGKVVRKLVVD